MKKLALFSLFVLLAIHYIGCARYTVGKESFASPSKALNRLDELHSQALGNITPTDKPVHGAALILFPSNAELQKNYTQLTGWHSQRTTREGIDYLLVGTKNSFQFIADAIRKKEVFDSTSIEQHNGNPAAYPIRNFDFLVFLDIDGWFIKSKDKQRPECITSKVDMNIEFPNHFLNELVLKANALREH